MYRGDHIGSLLRPKELLDAPSNIELEDKPFAVQAYQVYDPQSREDVERFYDIYKKGNLFDRVPYVQAAAFKAVVEQQSDPQLVALMKGVDYRKAVDNGTVDRFGKGRLLRRAIRSRHQIRARPKTQTRFEMRKPC